MFIQVGRTGVSLSQFCPERECHARDLSHHCWLSLRAVIISGTNQLLAAIIMVCISLGRFFAPPPPIVSSYSCGGTCLLFIYNLKTKAGNKCFAELPSCIISCLELGSCLNMLIHHSLFYAMLSKQEY